jgi:dipeptidyl aminopeptidase/acylaminoacyl peptidase
LARPLANGRGIGPEDYSAFEFLSDPQLSPDGKLAAYVVTPVDQKQNRRNSVTVNVKNCIPNPPTPMAGLHSEGVKCL